MGEINMSQKIGKILCPYKEDHSETAASGFQGNRCNHNKAKYGHCYTARSLMKCPELHGGDQV